ELVGHVGQELRLVPARDLHLPALLLQLPEQSRVLNGQRRLRGEGAEQLDGLGRELAGRLPLYRQGTDQPILPQQGNREQCAEPRPQERPLEPALIGPRCRDVRDLERPPYVRQPPQHALTAPDGLRPRRLHYPRVQVVRGPQVELLADLVVLEDRARVGAGQLVGARDDRRQDGLQV